MTFSRLVAQILFSAVLLTVSSCKTSSDTAGKVTSAPPVEEDVIFFHDVKTPDSLICEGRVFPLKFRMMKVDYPGLRKKLLAVPYPAKGIAPDTIRLAVPLPGGALSVFRIFPSTVMPPELAAKYPKIRTFAGTNIDMPSEQIRLEITPLGFTSMILTEKGSIMADPFCKTDSVHILVYNKNDLPPGAKHPFEK